MSKRIILVCVLAFCLVAGSAFAADQPTVKGPLAGAVHAVGSLTYKDGSQQSWNWDRGLITDLSSSSITLTRHDKLKVTFAITSSTVVRNDGSTYNLSNLQKGQVATVVSQNGNADIIRNIKGPNAPMGGDPSEIAGPAATSTTGTIDVLYFDGSTQDFDYNRGRIMQVGNGSLTIMRQDKVTVQLTYDANTIVRDCHGRLESTDDLAVGEGSIFLSQAGDVKLAGCLVQPKAHAGAGSQTQSQRPNGPRSLTPSAAAATATA
ncbi:MAG TPA: DUF5666 domain-containing protein [Gaiellaceae bacterium]